MEATRKRHEFVPADNSTQKKPRAAALSDDAAEDLGDDILAWLSVDDETIGELVMLLDDAEKNRPLTEKVKFIDDPYSSAMIFQSSSSYVTINGNEESCGSSFSDLDSSVMASVDMSGASIKLMEMDFETLEKWRSVSDLEDRLKAEEASTVSDGLSWDEEDLARFIGDEEQIF